MNARCPWFGFPANRYLAQTIPFKLNTIHCKVSFVKVRRVRGEGTRKTQELPASIMCKMNLKEMGDMQLSWQTATDWGHGMKEHGTLMSRKRKARATILSCVDILQEKLSQRTFIAPLTRSSLITKLHMLFTTMFAYCISRSACWLVPRCLLRSFLSGWLCTREVGLEDSRSVCMYARKIQMLGDGTHTWIALGTYLITTIWSDMLNKPKSIMLLPPFANSPCTAHIPYETQVYNLHKAA